MWQCPGTHCSQAPWTQSLLNKQTSWWINRHQAVGNILLQNHAYLNPYPQDISIPPASQDVPQLQPLFQRSLSHLPIRDTVGLCLKSKATQTRVLSELDRAIKWSYPRANSLSAALFSVLPWDITVPRKTTQLICLWLGVYPCIHIKMEVFWWAGFIASASTRWALMQSALYSTNLTLCFIMAV